MVQRILLLAVLLAFPAYAIDFVVNSSADDGPGTLRDAITQSNANGVFNLITFELPTGDNTISPLSALPAITNSVTIAGSPVTKGNPEPVVLSGTLAGDSNGLTIAADSVVIEA